MAAQPAPATVHDDGTVSVTILEDETETVRLDPVTGAIEIDQPDGGVIVRLNQNAAGAAGGLEDDPAEFYKNLINDIAADKIGLIVDDLIQGIEADDQSRAQSLADTVRGLDLLGLKQEEPKSSADSSGAAEGMSVVTNPLLLEMCLKGWANASAELLPATGPVKIDNESLNETEATDELAEAYEQGFNYYLTVTDKAYGPDTSHMLLWGVYFGGSGFKKVYRDPLKKRPVSKSVASKDLIVSDTTKDFSECERITHQIPMRPSIMKRMQMRGHYRDVTLSQPTPQPNAVETKIASIQGVAVTNNGRPEDQPYTLWECQCELVLDEFAPKEYRERNLALPFLVTIEKDSRQALAIRRDWKPDDEDCTRKQMYVRYPYVPGPGFYGTGMLHIVGNSSAALTAAWREMLDTGMYANFPGGLIAKLGTRQNSSTLRPEPGTFVPIETNDLPIKDVVMGMPYKDITPGLLGLVDKIMEQAKQVGSSADVPVGEGVQNVPVGTMLAHIEQATKIMAAAHKGMHAAQSEEIQLIADLFREDPESFWKGNRKAKRGYWDEQKLFTALQTIMLVPKSDPNVPSHVHRMMKAVALVQLLQIEQFKGILDPREVLERVLRAMKEDPDGLVIPPQPQAGGPSPDLITAQAKEKEAQAKILAVGVDEKKVQAGLIKESNDSAQQTAEIQADASLKQMDVRIEEIKAGAAMAGAGDPNSEAGREQQNEDRDFLLRANDQSLKAAADLRDHETTVREQDIKEQANKDKHQADMKKATQKPKPTGSKSK